MDEIDPNSAWAGAALLIAKKLGVDFYHALDRIVVRFLIDGDVRPLVEVLAVGREPGLRAAQFIGGMLDEHLRATIPADSAPRFKINIVDNRGRGKPSEKAIKRAKARREQIETGLRLLRNGRQAYRLFWITLRKALDPAPDFPLRAELVRIDGGTGRPSDPELSIRDFVLATLMEEKMAKKSKYEDPAADVLAYIEEQAADEGWTGKVGEETIRKAYNQRFGNPKKRGSFP
jgi:hypothetical protein